MRHPQTVWSLPTRERGLKYLTVSGVSKRYGVAPYAGAWIEIVKNCALNLGGVVAPYAGAWIEIQNPHNKFIT